MSRAREIGWVDPPQNQCTGVGQLEWQSKPPQIYSSIKVIRTLTALVKISLFRNLYCNERLAITQEVFTQDKGMSPGKSRKPFGVSLFPFSQPHGCPEHHSREWARLVVPQKPSPVPGDASQSHLQLPRTPHPQGFHDLT